MKKSILIFSAYFFLLVSFVFAYPIMDSEETSNNGIGTDYASLGFNGGFSNLAEKWQATKTYDTNQIAVFICEAGDTSSYVYNFSLWSHDIGNDEPDQLLASSVNMDLTGVSNCNTGEWYNVTLQSDVSITSGTYYWIVGGASGFDGTNLIRWRYWGSADGASGNSDYSADRNVWEDYSTNFLNYRTFNTTTNPTATFQPPTPADNTKNNTIYGIINVSCDVGNARIYFENVTPPTNIVKEVVGLNAQWVLNSSVISSEGTYYYYGDCGAGSIATATRTFIYDTSSPDISLNPNNFYASDNSSVLARINNTAVINITFTDNIDLFAYEINITDTSGNTIYYLLNESLSGTSYTLERIMDFTNFSLGEYISYVRSSDSHTKNQIGNYDVSTKNAEIEFNTKEGNIIKITTTDNADTSSIKTQEDRYNFQFDYLDARSDKPRVFDLYCDGKLYLQNTKYKGHFVCSNDGITGNWIDFEGQEAPKSIIKITDQHFQIRYDRLPSKTTFNSIGGLNTNLVVNSFNLISEYLYNTQMQFNSKLILNDSNEFNETYIISVNTTALNEIVQGGCLCDGCVLSGDYCKVPFDLFADNTGSVNIAMINYSYRGSYPENTYINVYGQRRWNYTGQFTGYEGINMNASLLESNVSSCTCTGCSEVVEDYCRVPILLHSDAAGILELSNITINYSKNLYIINEKNGTLFDVSNLTSVKIYSDDNNTYFDFTAVPTSTYNFSIEYNKLRLELEYPDGTIITRYLDTDLVGKDLRLCANIVGTTHYEQLIISNSQKAALMKSIFADCYVAADYTRFAYQNGYLLKAYTIDTQYMVSTYSTEGLLTELVGVDGSVASYINLDTIEFQQKGYNINILDSRLSVVKYQDTSFKIYYKNDDDSNTALNIRITKTDDNSVVYDNSDFSDLDEVTIFYDYTTLAGLNETTLFLIEAIGTNPGGTSTDRRYMNTRGASGSLPGAIAFVIVMFMFLFGITFASIKQVFGMFGIFVHIVGIVILAVAVNEWYVNFMMALELIAIIYTIIIMTRNSGSSLLG